MGIQDQVKVKGGPRTGRGSNPLEGLTGEVVDTTESKDAIREIDALLEAVKPKCSPFLEQVKDMPQAWKDYALKEMVGDCPRCLGVGKLCHFSGTGDGMNIKTHVAKCTRTNGRDQWSNHQGDCESWKSPCPVCNGTGFIQKDKK